MKRPKFKNVAKIKMKFKKKKKKKKRGIIAENKKKRGFCQDWLYLLDPKTNIAIEKQKKKNNKFGEKNKTKRERKRYFLLEQRVIGNGDDL